MRLNLEFDRSIHFRMYEWASCFCFLHSLKSSIKLGLNEKIKLTKK